MNIQKPFFIDQQKPGIVRGGFYDEMGGMLVGMRAQEVCDVLNGHEAMLKVVDAIKEYDATPIRPENTFDARCAASYRKFKRALAALEAT